MEDSEKRVSTSPISKTPKMGLMDLVLYGFILCVHVPLTLTYVMFQTFKDAVYATLSLPKRLINHAMFLVRSTFQLVENIITDIITFIQKSVYETTDTIPDEPSSKTPLTFNSLKDEAESKMREGLNMVRNVVGHSGDLMDKAKIPLGKTMDSLSDFTVSTANAIKAEAESKVHEGMNVVRNVVNTPGKTVESLSEFTASTANAIRDEAESKVRDGYNIVRNAFHKTSEYAEKSDNPMIKSANSLVDLIIQTLTAIKIEITSKAHEVLNIIRSLINQEKKTTDESTLSHLLSIPIEMIVRILSYIHIIINGIVTSFLNTCSDIKNYVYDLFNKNVNEPKIQYEEALTNTAKTLKERAIVIGKALQQFIMDQIDCLVYFLREIYTKGLDYFRQMKDDNHMNNSQANQNNQDPKNIFEKTYKKFQEAAFETERQTFRAEIMKLQEELNRIQHKEGAYERLQCDKQINDLQEQLARIHSNYTQQKTQLLGEFDREREEFKEEMEKLNKNYIDAQNVFDRERKGFEEKINQLMDEIEALQKEIAEYKAANHKEGDAEVESENSQDPDGTGKIDTRMKKPEEAGGKGSGSILNKMDSAGANLLKKKKKEAV